MSGSFGVAAKDPKRYVHSGRTHFGSVRTLFFFCFSFFFWTKSGNSETLPQALRNTESAIGVPSFRLGVSWFWELDGENCLPMGSRQFFESQVMTLTRIIS